MRSCFLKSSTNALFFPRSSSISCWRKITKRTCPFSGKCLEYATSIAEAPCLGDCCQSQPSRHRQPPSSDRLPRMQLLHKTGDEIAFEILEVATERPGDMSLRGGQVWIK